MITKINFSLKFIITFIALGILAFNLTIVMADDAENGNNNQLHLSTKIELVVSDFIKKYKVPGCAVVITNPHGQTTYSHGFGFADTETDAPFTADTLCQVASVSKSITGILTAQLIADGRLKLHEKVFPTLINQGIIHVEDIKDPRIMEITVENLLQQTSGMGDKNTVFVTKKLIERNKTPFINSKISPVDYLKLCLNEGLEGTPSEKYRYCNTNFVALNIFIAAICQDSLLNVANKRIFRPLDIKAKNFSSHISDKGANEAVCYDLGETFGPSALQENWGQKSSSSYGFIDYTPMELWCLSANGLKNVILNTTGSIPNTVFTDEARAIIGKVPNYDLGKDVNGTPAYWYQSAGVWLTWPSHKIGEGTVILNFSGNSNGALAAYKGLPDGSYVFLVGNGNILGHPGLSDELMHNIIRAIQRD